MQVCRGSPLEVERRLVQHYLYRDGAGGAGPLRYIDASDVELAEAFNASSAEEALRILYEGCGGDDSIARVLAEGWHARWPDPGAPGYFRYLVLTCTVVALADADENSQEFSRNLQRIFRTKKHIGSRRALTGLWAALAHWCLAQRSAGHPIREFNLPDRRPGGIHIGWTYAISFPNWRDVFHLRRYLESNRRIVVALKGPQDAARLLCAIVTDHRTFTPAMIAAAGEYYSLYQSQASLLYLHPFWAAVCTTLPTSQGKPHRRAPSVRIELEFSAVPEDTQLSVTAYRDELTVALDLPAPFTCPLGEAIERLETWGNEIPAAIRWRESLENGAVAFAESRYGVWAACDEPISAHNRWLFLIRSERVDVQSTLRGSQVQIAPGWFLVGPIRDDDAKYTHSMLSLHRRTSAYVAAPPLRLEGGVHTSVGWLGRPSLLPRVLRQGHGSIALLPESANSAQPSVDDLGCRPCAIRAKEALDGGYRLRLQEQVPGGTALAIEQRVRFVANAPEHIDLGHPGLAWQDDSEFDDRVGWTEFGAHRGKGIMVSRASDESPHQGFDDFLELVYASGRRGWGERELIEAISTLLPGPSPWDVLRALIEAGWLRKTTSIAWRASRLWLVRPHLMQLSPEDDGPLVLAGAAPAVVRQRFISTATTLGGEVAVRGASGGMMPSIVVAHGASGAELARELGWPIERALFAQPVAAPGCWPQFDSDVGRHRLYREWDWMLGRFVDPSGSTNEKPVRLTWWRRPEGDRADLYMVAGRTPNTLTTLSRTVALAEAFRQFRQPMFSVEEDVMIRSSREGYLPMHLAKSLGIMTLRHGGPMRIGHVWTYSYPTCGKGVALVSLYLGRHFLKSAGGNNEMNTPSASTLVGHARHRGGRLGGRFRG